MLVSIKLVCIFKGLPILYHKRRMIVLMCCCKAVLYALYPITYQLLYDYICNYWANFLSLNASSILVMHVVGFKSVCKVGALLFCKLFF